MASCKIIVVTCIFFIVKNVFTAETILSISNLINNATNALTALHDER